MQFIKQTQYCWWQPAVTRKPNKGQIIGPSAPKQAKIGSSVIMERTPGKLGELASLMLPSIAI